MLRQGTGPKLVFFHGVLGSERMWRHVIPLVAPRHDAIALTALGHRGGNRAQGGPTRFADVIDDAQRTLDGLGIDRAHLVGNSMGGWVALELARRGRATTVCAFSPAGCWPAPSGGTGRGPATDRLRATIRQTRLGRPLLPLLVRSARFRRWALQLNAMHGDRVLPADLVASADDVLGCHVGLDLLSTNEALAPFSSLPCPITIAWSERDRVLPMKYHWDHARAIVPGARFIVLSDVGHVPMFDSPEIVARTVLECTGAEESRAEQASA